MSLINLQKKIGATPDGAFGPGTIKSAMAFYKMSPFRAAHFFAQTSHETGGYRLLSENLNYSAEGLQKTFGRYFPSTVLAISYSKQPEKIANRVYGSRMGNGDEASGDGWKFRGRGALQTTGKSNYLAFSTSIGKPEIMTNPDLVATDYSFESAIFFFEKNKLWDICDKGVDDATILAITKKINGGTNGLVDRVHLTKKFYEWVK